MNNTFAQHGSFPEQATTALLHLSVGVDVEHQIGGRPETSWNLRASCMQRRVGVGRIEQGIHKLGDFSGCYEGKYLF